MCLINSHLCSVTVKLKNNFTGSIPYQIWFSKKLNYLNASHNKIDGKLSNVIYRCEKLYSLDLSYNNISGAIPEKLAKSKAYLINLSNNKLDGCFPGALKSLCNKDVTFYNNHGLPNNGNFKEFCKHDKGNCELLPACVPNLIFLNGNADSVYYDEKIKWAKVDGATGYYLSLGTTADSFDLINNTDVGNVTIYDAGDLPKNSRLYAKIQSYNSYGFSVYCDTFSFKTTDLSDVQDPEADNNIFELYPNPADDYVMINIHDQISGDIHIDILTVTAEKVLSFDINENTKNDKISLRKLHPGIYLFKFSYDDNTYYKKLVIE